MNVDLSTKPQYRRQRQPKEELLTFEQFCDLIHEDQKADLINGVIYMQSPPSILHELVFGLLFHLLDLYVRRKKLGIVIGSRAAARLSEYDGPEPDIMFISKERQHLVQHAFVDGAPDLIVEITSPSTAHIDRGIKKQQYAAGGVREYWMIDPIKRTAEFFINHHGQWETIPVTADGVFRSMAVSGFWLNSNWLFAEELPDPYETVSLLLNIALPKE
jgi:Uma2 family endonuclease